jgi:hypothetical protein
MENDAMNGQVTVCQLRLDEVHVALSEVVAAADRRARLLVPFEGTWNGQPMVVTAVLERTAVAYPVESPGDPNHRRLVRQPDVVVAPGRLRWVTPRAGRRRGAFERWVREELKRCSDCRRTSAETEFRAYKAAYCVECSRRRQAVIDQRRRQRAA